MAFNGKQFLAKAYTAAGVLGAATLVAVLAFISIEASLLAAGFIVSTGFVLNDLRRRRFWENAVTFKIKTLENNDVLINEKMAGTRQDVMRLRQQMAETAIKIETQAEKIEEQEIKTEKPARIFSRTPLMKKPDVPAPRASKPGKALPPNANDDEFNDLSDVVVKELVHHAVRSKEIEVFVQPIVRLPQRKVRFYEMFARIRARPGLYLPASRYLTLARQENLANDIDNMLLIECLKTIKSSAHIERAAPIFINIGDAALRNTVLMKRLITFVAAHRHLAPRLVLEIPYAQYQNLQPALLEILRGLGKLGCSVSLDHVDSLDLDIAELQRFHVRFVKIGIRKMMPFTNNDKRRVEIIRQKRKLESNGIGVIVEKVESESDLRELLDFDIHYGQGYLFGRPDLEATYRKNKAA